MLYIKTFTNSEVYLTELDIPHNASIEVTLFSTGKINKHNLIIRTEYAYECSLEKRNYIHNLAVNKILKVIKYRDTWPKLLFSIYTYLFL